MFVDSFETYSAHDWRFVWLKSRLACACDLLKADTVSPLSSRLWRTLVSSARLAFRASRNSSSTQGFDFLGMVVALGMLSLAALVKCSTKEFKGSPSSRISSVILSMHKSWNCSQSALENPNGKDHSSVVSLPLMVGSMLIFLLHLPEMTKYDLDIYRSTLNVLPRNINNCCFWSNSIFRD